VSPPRGDRSSLRSPLLLPLALLLLGGCGDGDRSPRAFPEEEGDPGLPGVSVVDDAGRRIELDAPPGRILSLVPSATRTLLALGAGSRLVGRTDFDTLPPLDTLPTVGGGLQPSLERVASLEPDLVVRFAAPSDRRTPERLDALGIAHLAVRPDGIDDIRRMVRLLARTTGRPGRGDSIVARIDRNLASVRRRVEGRRRPRVAFVLGGTPPWVAGPGTFLSELIEVAGGTNVFADLGELYGPVSPEAFVSREIDLLLTVEGEDPGVGGLGIPLRALPPVVRSPGPEVDEAAGILARTLHPDAFR